MSESTKFWLDIDNTRSEILFSPKISEIEVEYMQSLMSQIEAEFLQTFGFKGDFRLVHRPTKTRERYSIESASSKTTRTLNKNPGWLGKFVEQPL